MVRQRDAFKLMKVRPFLQTSVEVLGLYLDWIPLFKTEGYVSPIKSFKQLLRDDPQIHRYLQTGKYELVIVQQPFEEEYRAWAPFDVLSFEDAFMKALAL